MVAVVTTGHHPAQAGSDEVDDWCLAKKKFATSSVEAAGAEQLVDVVPLEVIVIVIVGRAGPCMH